VAADGKLEIHVKAADPDFALRPRGDPSGKTGRPKARSAADFWDIQAPQPGKAGDFVGNSVFEPAKLGLKAGDRVEFWPKRSTTRSRRPIARRRRRKRSSSPARRTDGPAPISRNWQSETIRPAKKTKERITPKSGERADQQSPDEDHNPPRNSSERRGEEAGR